MCHPCFFLRGSSPSLSVFLRDAICCFAWVNLYIPRIACFCITSGPYFFSCLAYCACITGNFIRKGRIIHVLSSIRRNSCISSSIPWEQACQFLLFVSLLSNVRTLAFCRKVTLRTEIFPRVYFSLRFRTLQMVVFMLTQFLFFPPPIDRSPVFMLVTLLTTVLYIKCSQARYSVLCIFKIIIRRGHTLLLLTKPMPACAAQARQ